MVKFKPGNYDQLVMLPISLESQLAPATLEHAIHELGKKHIDLIDQMKTKIDSPEGEQIYARRLALLSRCLPIAVSKTGLASRCRDDRLLEKQFFDSLVGRLIPANALSQHATICFPQHCDTMTS